MDFIVKYGPGIDPELAQNGPGWFWADLSWAIGRPGSDLDELGHAGQCKHKKNEQGSIQYILVQ